MTDSPIINGLSVFFTVTTVAVFLYPIIKLAPSWLEGRLGKKIAFHRDAIDALATAIILARDDSEHVARLAAQQDYHRAALLTLAPEPVTPAAPRQDVNAAA